MADLLLVLDDGTVWLSQCNFVEIMQPGGVAIESLDVRRDRGAGTTMWVVMTARVINYVLRGGRWRMKAWLDGVTSFVHLGEGLSDWLRSEAVTRRICTIVVMSYIRSTQHQTCFLGKVRDNHS